MRESPAGAADPGIRAGTVLLPPRAGVSPAGPPPGPASAPPRRGASWRRFRRNRLAFAGLIVLMLMGTGALLAGALSSVPHDRPNLEAILESPAAAHPLGTDTLGRDHLSRLLHGARVSLAVGIGVALVAGLAGTLVGAVAGYAGGRLDELLMRITDFFLAVPLLVGLMIVARGVGGGTGGTIIALSLFFWMPVARIVRGVFLSLKECEFVEAARAAGASGPRIILRHLLPNAAGPIIVNITLSVAAAILFESVLSFLGFGVQPPTPSWGNMLAESKSLATTAPWLVWFPGIAILVTVLSVNLVGEGLRDALDPGSRGRRP